MLYLLIFVDIKELSAVDIAEQFVSQEAELLTQLCLKCSHLPSLCQSCRCYGPRTELDKFEWLLSVS